MASGLWGVQHVSKPTAGDAPRRLLLAFDKFKGSLTAEQACAAAAAAIRRMRPHWSIDEAPLSDGGDGFCALLTQAAHGQLHAVEVTGPLGTAVEAQVGLVASSHLPEAARTMLHASEAERIAVIEMASASGLTRVPEDQRDVWRSSSRGTGELLRAAARLGADRVLLGIGGSATSDLGLGALSALGLRFADDTGNTIDPTPANWDAVRQVSGQPSPDLPPLSVACDVGAPLFGPRGAGAVYGPQKGLHPDDLQAWERQGQTLAERVASLLGVPAALQSMPGAGAAGGMGWALAAAAGGRIVPGFELVSAWLDLPARIASADWVLTGEGCFDDSSLTGKGPFGVVQHGARLGRPCVVFAGAVRLSSPSPAPSIAISPPTLSAQQACAQAAHYLERAVGAWLEGV